MTRHLVGRKALMAGFVGFALVFLWACGGGDSGNNGGGAADSPATEAADSPDAEPDNTATAKPADTSGSGSGSATLTIGDESWSFDDIFCAFSPDEARNERVSFTLSAFGKTAEGVRIQLDATIQDPSREGRYDGEDVIKSVTLDDAEDFENPSVQWTSISGFGTVELDFQVDGKNVTVDAAFDDGRTDEIETIAGALIATCP
jgi:hypothetical protein